MAGVRVTCDVWATSVPILVFPASVLELGQMYATDRRQTKASLNCLRPIEKVLPKFVVHVTSSPDIGLLRF